MFLRAHFLHRTCECILCNSLWTLTLLLMMMNVSVGRNGLVEISIQYIQIIIFPEVKVNSAGGYLPSCEVASRISTTFTNT